MAARKRGLPNTRDVNGAGTKPKIVSTYDYADEDGAPLFQVVRLDPKAFRQRRPARPDDPPDKVKDGWVWSLEGVRRVLFRLPELSRRWRSSGAFLSSRAKKTF